LTQLSLSYIPCPNTTTAKELAQGMLEAHMIACANILPPSTSLYRWEGAMAEEEEVILLVKSTRSLQEAIITYVEHHHPYDTPAVLCLSVQGASMAFAAWIGEEVQENIA